MHKSTTDQDNFLVAWGADSFMDTRPKKYRPPRPKGVKGGCSPQNNLAKLFG